MGKETGIGWCHHTFNIAWGCVKSTAGCDHCYAETLDHRWGFNSWGVDATRRTFGAKHWNEPIKWNRDAFQNDAVRRVFCSSMTDYLLNDPTIDAEREKLWPLIEKTPSLEWLLLTKHPERYDRVPTPGLQNARFGITFEHPDTAWRLKAQFKLRRAGNNFPPNFISAEPLLGDISEDLRLYINALDWVIVGGESGANARPMNLDWARKIRDLCAEHGVPFFLKQLGGVRDARAHDDAVIDGRLHQEFPSPAFYTPIFGRSR